MKDRIEIIIVEPHVVGLWLVAWVMRLMSGNAGESITFY